MYFIFYLKNAFLTWIFTQIYVMQYCRLFRTEVLELFKLNLFIE